MTILNLKNDLTLITRDALSLPLKSKSVDLIITHPPYLGIDTERYGGDPTRQINSSRNKKKMLKLLLKATIEMKRVLSSNGHIIIANGAIDGLDEEYIRLVTSKLNLILVEKIVQNSFGFDEFGMADSRSFEKIQTAAITTWYHLSVSNNFFFNPYKVAKYANPVWSLPANNMLDPIDIELSKSHHVLDVMNKEIPKRFIEMFSKKGQTVLDPFGGSGLVAITAVEMGRAGISNDISKSQTQAAKLRASMTLERNS